MCKKWLCNWLCNYDKDIPNPDIVGDIDATELYSILKAEFGEDTLILLSDNKYKLATMESFKSFLKADGTDKYSYTSEWMDCDDYSQLLAGRASIPKWSAIPIGTCWLSKPAHAVNVFVDENKDVYLVEPQNDKIMLYSDRYDDGWRAFIIWI